MQYRGTARSVCSVVAALLCLASTWAGEPETVRVSLSVTSVPLREVVGELMYRAGADWDGVMPVDGKPVTIRLRRVPLGKALESLLSPYGASYGQIDGTFKVWPTRLLRESDVPISLDADDMEVGEALKPVIAALGYRNAGSMGMTGRVTTTIRYMPPRLALEHLAALAHSTVEWKYERDPVIWPGREPHPFGYVDPDLTKVTLRVRDLPISDVLKELRKQTGLNYSFDPELDGPVTLEVRDKPLAKVMRAIADQLHGGFTFDGFILAIGRADGQLVTFELKNRSVRDFLKVVFGRVDSKYAVHPEVQGSLTVGGYRATATGLLNYLSWCDARADLIGDTYEVCPVPRAYYQLVSADFHDEEVRSAVRRLFADAKAPCTIPHWLRGRATLVAESQPLEPLAQALLRQVGATYHYFNHKFEIVRLPKPTERPSRPVHWQNVDLTPERLKQPVSFDTNAIDVRIALRMLLRPHRIGWSLDPRVNTRHRVASHLKDVPLDTAIRHVCSLVRATCIVVDGGVCVVPQEVYAGPERPVTAEAINADVREFLRKLAAQGDEKLWIHPSVSGTVTIRLQDVPLRRALRVVADRIHASWCAAGGTFEVIPFDPNADAHVGRYGEEMDVHEALDYLFNQIHARYVAPWWLRGNVDTKESPFTFAGALESILIQVGATYHVENDVYVIERRRP